MRNFFPNSGTAKRLLSNREKIFWVEAKDVNDETAIYFDEFAALVAAAPG